MMNEPGIQGILNAYDQMTFDEEGGRFVHHIANLLNPADNRSARTYDHGAIRRMTGLGMTAGLLLEISARNDYTLRFANMRRGLLPAPKNYTTKYSVRRRFVNTLRDEAKCAIERAGPSPDIVDWLTGYEESGVDTDPDHQAHIRYGAGIIMACAYRLNDQLPELVPDTPIDWDQGLRHLSGTID